MYIIIHVHVHPYFFIMDNFNYTCVQDAPAEEANVVEKILCHRVRPAHSEEEKEKHGEFVEEYLVKYKN